MSHSQQTVVPRTRSKKSQDSKTTTRRQSKRPAIEFKSAETVDSEVREGWMEGGKAKEETKQE